jgi:Leucine-rich repeat (LRR) protein
LRLNGNQLETLPPEIGNLKGTLQRLYLRGNKISAAEKSKISELLPGCDVIY